VYNENEMKSVLLFRLGGLGDLLVAFPSIFLLRKKLFPCSLSLVCREEYGLILKETGVVDNLVSSSQASLAPLFESPPYPQELTQWLGEFSLILGWLQKENSLNQKEFCAFLDREKCRFFVAGPDFLGQISRYFFERTREFLSKEEGSSHSFSDCTLMPLSSSQREEGLKLLGEEFTKHKDELELGTYKIVVVHPGSGSKSKCWPLENFLEIINELDQEGYRGALVTGNAEAELENKLKKQALPKRWVWLHNPPLLKLSGLLTVSALYLGNDSGITHLAAACGTKVVALFRNDLEAAWRPYGQTVVLSEESVFDISPHSVWEAVSQILE
jgi:ADP-heptose:LPS heptosyltransferase